MRKYMNIGRVRIRAALSEDIAPQDKVRYHKTRQGKAKRGKVKSGKVG